MILFLTFLVDLLCFHYPGMIGPSPRRVRLTGCDGSWTCSAPGPSVGSGTLWSVGSGRAGGAREAREAARRAEEERRELEAREAQEAAWRQQQAEAAEEQQRQEAAREKEREAYEEFKAGITAEAVARAEKEAQHELGFGLELTP